MDSILNNFREAILCPTEMTEITERLRGSHICALDACGAYSSLRVLRILRDLVTLHFCSAKVNFCYFCHFCGTKKYVQFLSGTDNRPNLQYLARQLRNTSRPFDGSGIPKWERQEERLSLHPFEGGGGLEGGLVPSLGQGGAGGCDPAVEDCKI